MSLRVLLAEDDPDIQLVARLSLRKAGFTVTAVADGAAVLRIVAEDRPDVVLLDWMMPEMDGFEACSRLMADPSTSDIPVIFLTAKSQESEINRGLALGARGYITKPFDALALGKQVQDLLSR
jgi:two-component system phosphate regulon response regulator PhoB